MDQPVPTDRELTILRVLWGRGEATVRDVYEALRDDLPIVQNTVQAFLRAMADKGLVTFRTEGRSFVYRATVEPET
ncbi:MAG: BlaI/MecI/CopY family transcriptional regulator, partial [Planctomycetota bacterium]